MDLLHTYGTTLVECNPGDQRWGIALSIDSEEKVDRLQDLSIFVVDFCRSQWRGQNWLGEILTSIRRWFWNSPDYRDDVEEVVDDQLV